MAEPEVRINTALSDGAADLEMQGGDEVESTEAGAADAPGAEDTEEQSRPPPTRTTFVE